MTKNNLPATKPQNENNNRQPRAAYSDFEIEKRTVTGSNGNMDVEPRYLLLSMEGWDNPFSLRQLEDLHRFLGEFLDKERV